MNKAPSAVRRKLPYGLGQYELVEDTQRLWEIMDALEASGERHALDFETTAFTPEHGRVRLSSISGPVGNFLIDHDKTTPFDDMAWAMAELPWSVFHCKFELSWFVGFDPADLDIVDVGHMRRALKGGGGFKLMTLAQWDLDISMDKTEQASDWSRPDLTDEQLDYAGADGPVTQQLYLHYKAEMDAASEKQMWLLQDAVPPIMEMEETGVLIDVDYHKTLIRRWSLRRDTILSWLKRMTPQVDNFNSDKQVREILLQIFDDASLAAWPRTEKGGDLSCDRDALVQAAHRSPYPLSRWLAGVAAYKRVLKYLSTYGESLITKQLSSPDGRLHFSLNIGQAVTRRLSSSGPNLQNIPRSKIVRRSFMARPGCSLILADYSGIELRVLAEMSGDERMLQETIHGSKDSCNDMHTMAASDMFQLAPEAVSGEQRSRAKAFNFQLTYGAGPSALAVVLRCTYDEAVEYLNRWAKRYPKAYAMRTIWHAEAMATGYLHTQGGGPIWVGRRVALPKAANYPVQGSAADVMYAACRRVYDLLRQTNLPIRMVVTVHDELLLECRHGFEEEAKRMLVEGMKQGWLDVFPGTSTDNLVEAVAGQFWSDKA